MPLFTVQPLARFLCLTVCLMTLFSVFVKCCLFLNINVRATPITFGGGGWYE